MANKVKTYQLCMTHIPLVPKTPGIYMVFSRACRTRYIGSTIDLNERFRNHFFKLHKGNHPNRLLQRLFHKRGGVLFFRVVAHCPSEALVRLEQKTIDAHRHRKILNRTLTAAGHSGR
jgi:excinuclease UvrABC nuclease subunit